MYYNSKLYINAKISFRCINFHLFQPFKIIFWKNAVMSGLYLCFNSHGQIYICSSFKRLIHRLKINQFLSPSELHYLLKDQVFKPKLAIWREKKLWLFIALLPLVFWFKFELPTVKFFLPSLMWWVILFFYIVIYYGMRIPSLLRRAKLNQLLKKQRVDKAMDYVCHILGKKSKRCQKKTIRYFAIMAYLDILVYLIIHSLEKKYKEEIRKIISYTWEDELVDMTMFYLENYLLIATKGKFLNKHVNFLQAFIVASSINIYLKERVLGLLEQYTKTTQLNMSNIKVRKASLANLPYSNHCYFEEYFILHTSNKLISKKQSVQIFLADIYLQIVQDNTENKMIHYNRIQEVSLLDTGDMVRFIVQKPNTIFFLEGTSATILFEMVNKLQNYYDTKNN